MFAYEQWTKTWQTWQVSEAAVQRCSIKIGVLKNSTIFTGKHLCWSLLLIKFQAFRPCLPVNIAKFSQTAFFTEHLPVAASEVLKWIFILTGRVN